VSAGTDSAQRVTVGNHPRLAPRGPPLVQTRTTHTHTHHATHRVPEVVNDLCQVAGLPKDTRRQRALHLIVEGLHLVGGESGSTK
jgi:fatty acid desaturase